MKLKNKNKLSLLGLILILVLGPLAYFRFVKPKSTKAASWAQNANEWTLRKRLTLVNNSGQTFEANTTYSVTVNTKALFDAGNLQSGCQDIRVYYQPDDHTNKKLNYYFDAAAGSTCATSEATTLYFPLQANISNSGEDDDYYLYYKNSAASSESTIDAFDIGAKSATFYCGFKGDTTCANITGSTNPTTESGAIRYSGSKSAMSFDGVDDNVNNNSDTSLDDLHNGAFTAEAWIYPKIHGWDKTIFDKGGYVDGFSRGFGIKLEYIGDYYIYGGVDDQYTRFSVTNLAGDWHHIVLTYDDNGDKKARVYLDGVLKGTTNAVSAKQSDASYSMLVGKGTGGRYFNGLIDEVRISNTVRYSSNFTPQTSPFVRDEFTKLLLHFDENGDDPRKTGQAVDDSGNANHGTITGAKYVAGLVGVDGSAEIGQQSAQIYGGHQGIFIEEGTTNLITNPSFEHTTYNIGWTTPYFNYGTSPTFSPLLSKRNSHGPFAAGITLQGDWATENGDADSVSYSSTSFGGNFLNTYDANQGSFVFWITPEWNGNDGISHYIWYVDGNNYIRKDSSNNLGARFNAEFTNTVSISNWTAGVTYLVIIRFDNRNTLDGTNYSSISIGNSHSFGNTSVDTYWLGSSTSYIGKGSSDQNPANATIEGFTIYRRPLWDGAYGINVGNGDEIEQIYNNGTGQDPTLITGSWDVVFALPTDATTGSMGIGGSQAWSHPHASNVLYTSTTNTGGFMMGVGYTADGWMLEGSPTNIVGLSAPEKIYAGGYKWDSDDYNEGLKYTKSSLTAGQNYVVRAVANSGDGTGQPKVFIYDETNGADITSFTGTVGSGRTAPDILLFTFELPTAARNGVASDCTSISVKLVNAANSGTVHWHQIELLQNLLDNPSLDVGSSASGYWLPSGYTNENMVSGNTSISTSIKHSGSSAVLANSNIGYNSFAQLVTSTVDKFYSGGWFIYSNGTTSIPLRQLNGNLQTTGTLITGSSSAVVSWKELHGIFKATATNLGYRFRFEGSTGENNRFLDDAYYILLTDVSLTLTPANLANSTETTGLRVDGADTLSQPITGVTSESGIFKFKLNPRHNFGIGSSFGFASPVIFTAYGDSDDYIKVYKQGNTLMTLGSFAGTTAPAIWSSPTLNVGGTYPIVISYARGGSLTLGVGNSNVATGSIGTGLSFGTTPTTAYFGSDSSGSNQYDCTITNFETLVPSVNTTSPYYKFGSKSAKIVTANTDEYAIGINTGSAATHTLSVYVYDGTTGNVGGTVSSSIASLMYNGAVQTTTYTDIGGGWWRLTYSAAAGSGSQNYGIQVKSGKTIYVDGFQLEQKVYSTTYVDGSLGVGYSWLGAANENSSSRTAATTNYPYTVDVNQHSISFWIKPTLDWRQGSNSEITYGLFDTNPSNVNCFRVKIGYSTGSQFTLQTEIIPPTGSRPSRTKAITANWKEQWHHIAYIYDDTNNIMNMFVDGAGVGELDISSYNSVTGTGVVRLGSTNGVRADAIFSDFQIFNSALSSTEVADLYYSGLGSHKEGSAVEQFPDGEPATSLWHLDEGTGTTIYDSLGTNNGSLATGNSAPTWATEASCISGKCLQFDGTSDYATIPGNITGIKTLSFWVKPSSATTPIMTLNGTQSISLTSNILGATNVTSPNIYVNGKNTTTVNSDEWSHVIMTSETPFGASDLTFGKVGTNYFTGYLDEIRLYPYALTVAQVNKDKNLGAGVIIGGGPEIPQVTPIKSKLVSHWKFDEGYGTIAHDSIGSNDGTFGVSTAAPTWSLNGKFGKALSFDGSNDYVQMNTTAFQFITGDFSVTIWANPAVLDNTYDGLITTDNTLDSAWKIVRDTNNQYFNARYASTYVAYPTVTTGVWHQYGYVKSGSSLILYLDGKLTSTTTISGSISNSATSLVLGSYRVNDALNSAHMFNGLIDEVKIYNTALSEDEIKQDYNRGAAMVVGSLSSGTGNTAPSTAASQEYCIPGDTAVCSPPVARWDFNEGVGTSAFDTSGNGNDGSLVGPIWTSGKIGKALSFDGSNDYVSPPNLTSLFSTQATLSLWVKRNNNTPVVQTQTGSWYLGGSDANHHYPWTDGNIYDGTFSSVRKNVGPGIITDRTKWHHVTITANSVANEWKFYQNGQLVYNGTADTFTFPAIAKIGQSMSSNNFNFYGLIDQVRIYNYARTPAQIAWDYNRGAPVAHWDLDECQGETLHDRTGANTATLTIGGSGTQTTGGTCSAPTDGTAAWANGSVGKYVASLNFDGTDDFISVGTGFTAQSVSFWVKPVSSTASMMQLSASAYISASSGTISASGFSAPTIYVNGAPSTTLSEGVWQMVTVTTATGIPAGAIKFGLANGTYYSGQMDQVKIWNYPLTSAQIKNEFNQGSAVRFGD